VCDFSLFIFCAVDVVDRDWSGEFFAPYSESFSGVFVNEVVGCATIYEGGFISLGL
jgi:hypothetical protein